MKMHGIEQRIRQIYRCPECGEVRIFVRTMIEITGRSYGWFNLGRAALLHLPVFRFLVSPDTDDEADSAWPPFCSQAVAAATRAGGVDPVPNLADRLTEPADLSRSSFYKLLFTLT